MGISLNLLRKTTIFLLSDSLSSLSYRRKMGDIQLISLDSELNKLVMDYLVTGGYPNAAEKFSREANVQTHTSWDAIVERVEIRDAIHKGDLQSAIEKINELNPEVSTAISSYLLPIASMISIVHAPLIISFGGQLMKANYFSPQYESKQPSHRFFRHTDHNSITNTIPPNQILDTDKPLHFKLRRLQLIEMIRTYLSSPTKENTALALEFANQDLAPFAPTSPEFLHGLQEAMGLFILAPTTSSSSAPPSQYSHLLSPSLRRTVAEEVNQAILASQGSSREARLYELVKTRQWAERQAREKKVDLPIRLDMGLDGDAEIELSATNGSSNGHTNGSGEDSVMGDGNEGEGGPQAAVGLRRVPTE
jgi:hypothetical protein